MAERYSFRAHVRLKDIIGQGLINNSNIAIIELIKNAKDAGSSKVEIVFSQAHAGDPTSTIVVRDHGAGMSLDDIASKWLNIAYSEKRVSARQGRGYYAGEKGIGRFSCDRLGAKLDLYSKRHDTAWTHLEINWADFELDDPAKQISDIELHPAHLGAGEFPHEDPSDRPRGTTLVIRSVRETWGETELRKLQKELERFVIDPHGEFKVHFKSNDIKDKNSKLVFDGYIENKLLSRIDEKTIAISSAISSDGQTIRNEIHHLGHVILSYEMDNPYDSLRNIRAKIHYLSQNAKISFKAITGYTSTEYGSVMLFLNGFRVMPYGEPKDDWLQLNERKNQGNSRYLGTRELFGLVEVMDETRAFVPVSSREGLAHNAAFSQLTDDDAFAGAAKHAYLTTLVRTLEKYVVEGMDWDRIAPENEQFSYEDLLASVNAIVKASSKSGAFRKIFIDEPELRRIAREKVEEVRGFVSTLMERVADKSVYELTKSDKRDLKRYVERHEGALAARAEVTEAYREKASIETKRRLFAEAHSSTDAQRITEIQHLIGLWGTRIEDDIRDAMHHLGNRDFEEANRFLEGSFLLIKKINKLSAILTKANFNLMTDSMNLDVFEYVREYIGEIRSLNSDIGSNVDVAFFNDDATALRLNFSPLEVSMMLDNAISNSMKTSSRRIRVEAHSDDRYHYLDVIDDGAPLDLRFAAEDLFKAGITTTTGSGIGLSHVREIAGRLDATTSIFSNSIGGSTLRLRWDR
ncbi:ATP-binding protein (plasmid) [Rhizobium leguminosarum]